jgi:hypothetical protein
MKEIASSLFRISLFIRMKFSDSWLFINPNQALLDEIGVFGQTLCWNIFCHRLKHPEIVLSTNSTPPSQLNQCGGKVHVESFRSTAEI